MTNLFTRTKHTSAVSHAPLAADCNDCFGNILLAGGIDEREHPVNLTEVYPIEGGQHLLFILDHTRESHCSITLNLVSFTIALIGGTPSGTEVTEYTIRRGNVTSRELPAINIGRSGHACGAYSVDGVQVTSPPSLLLRC